jgi:hypothetical protein
VPGNSRPDILEPLTISFQDFLNRGSRNSMIRMEKGILEFWQRCSTIWHGSQIAGGSRLCLRFQFEHLFPLGSGFVEGVERITAGDHAVSGGRGAFAESPADEFS